MNTNSKKTSTKNTAKLSSVRLNSDCQKLAVFHREFANKKKFGRKIKIADIISLGLKLIQPEHIKTLQIGSLTNEDRKEQLRQIYIERNGPISKEDFTGFMMTDDFTVFRKELTLKPD